ncbi:MAG: hypothetical protein Q8N07_04715, partial [Rhodocyclaceae bacterium]|nr:hypothetical protein [Rhodocyclaceae bacterium]
TRLDTFAMTVITFRSLIIETDDASAALPVIEPIFEWMLASIDWPGKSPNHDFENCAILKIHAMPIHQIRAHVVNAANTLICCQSRDGENGTEMRSD